MSFEQSFGNLLEPMYELMEQLNFDIHRCLPFCSFVFLQPDIEMFMLIHN